MLRREPAHTYGTGSESNPCHIGGRRSLSSLHHPCSPNALSLLHLITFQKVWMILISDKGKCPEIKLSESFFFKPSEIFPVQYKIFKDVQFAHKMFPRTGRGQKVISSPFTQTFCTLKSPLHDPVAWYNHTCW